MVCPDFVSGANFLSKDSMMLLKDVCVFLLNIGNKILLQSHERDDLKNHTDSSLRVDRKRRACFKQSACFYKGVTSKEVYKEMIFRRLQKSD